MRFIVAQRLERLFKLKLLLVIIGLAAFLGTLFVGSITTISLQDAQQINQQVNSSVPPNATLLGLTYAIFQNNLKIALFGFIPFLIGSGLLLFIGFSTGIAFSGDALISTTRGTPVTGPELVLATTLFPFFFWELSGYALTMMEGIVITRGLIKGNRIERFVAPGHFRDGELFKALLVVAMTAIILFIAALMESYLIVLARP